MYKLNNVNYDIVRTWSFAGEYRGDPRDGMICVELKSSCNRYRLIIDSEQLNQLA